MAEFAKCMRSNGVPNFQEPKPGGTGEVPIGASPTARSFKTAERKCQKFMSGGGLPGSGEAPSPQTLAHYLKIAQCMRRHGVSGFPDPTTSMPSKPPAGGGEISDIEGAILVAISVDPECDGQRGEEVFAGYFWILSAMRSGLQVTRKGRLSDYRWERWNAKCA